MADTHRCGCFIFKSERASHPGIEPGPHHSHSDDLPTRPSVSDYETQSRGMLQANVWSVFLLTLGTII